MTPFVLVHGLGVTSRYWRPLAAALPRPSLAPELTRRPSSVTALAALLLRDVDGAGIGRTSFVANSLGCQIVLELAAAHPDRVASLTLVGPTGDPRPRTRAQLAARLAATAVHEPPALLGLVAYEYFRAGPLRVRRQARALVGSRTAELLPAIQCPVLVVRGEHDRVSPQDWAERLVAELPHAELAVVAGGGHAVHFSHARQVARLVEELEQLGGDSDR